MAISLIRSTLCCGLVLLGGMVSAESDAAAMQISESQAKYVKKYEKQDNIPNPAEMLLNTDAEPSLEDGFVALYNGTDLSGWVALGGTCTFEPQGEAILGTVVQGSSSTYLCTERSDYADFIFTCEISWQVPVNSGVMFRAQTRGKNNDSVFGPQAELAGVGLERGWSGGLYGQSAGGWIYPLWLNAHETVRGAMVEGWNRLTIHAEGETIKTWVNGIPAAHWVTDTYRTGRIGLQVHKADKGAVLFRNVRIKELSAP